VRRQVAGSGQGGGKRRFRRHPAAAFAIGALSSRGRLHYHSGVASSEVFVELRARGAVGWVRADLAAVGLAPFWLPLAPFPGAKGRGGVGVLQVAGLDLVVRPNRRGGALGRLLQDRYASPARARRELELLAALRELGVAAVAPVAAVASRRGPFWRLRLCTERLADALPVPAFLARHPASRRAAFAALGAAVQRAFAVGLVHPDLHADNLLCRVGAGGVEVAFVDLDRARLEPLLPRARRDAMLARMQRYLLRHGPRLAAVPTRSETLRFLRQVEPERAARHALWRELAARLVGTRARATDD
jgi:3-deoxy-D-manno-octulosonic acid kinase